MEDKKINNRNYPPYPNTPPRDRPIVEQTCEDCLEFSPGHDGPDPAEDDCWGVPDGVDETSKEYFIMDEVWAYGRDARDCPWFKPGRLH